MATLLHELLEITSDLGEKRNRICGLWRTGNGDSRICRATMDIDVLIRSENLEKLSSCGRKGFDIKGLIFPLRKEPLKIRRVSKIDDDGEFYRLIYCSSCLKLRCWEKRDKLFYRKIICLLFSKRLK